MSRFIWIACITLLCIGCENKEYAILIVGVVEQNSPGASAGVEIGDIIISVNDENPESWNVFNQLAEMNLDKPLFIKIKRGLDTVSTNLVPRKNTGQGIGTTGISPYLMMILVEETPPPGSPARRAGFLTKDVILNVNKKPVTSFLDIITPVKESQGKMMEFVVKRQNAIVTLRVTPACDSNNTACKIGLPMIGVSAEEVD
ncbi:MAG: PDZ domain-containing protein [Fibrobacterales bacterium]